MLVDKFCLLPGCDRLIHEPWNKAWKLSNSVNPDEKFLSSSPPPNPKELTQPHYHPAFCDTRSHLSLRWPSELIPSTCISFLSHTHSPTRIVNLPYLKNAQTSHQTLIPPVIKIAGDSGDRSFADRELRTGTQAPGLHLVPELLDWQGGPRYRRMGFILSWWLFFFTQSEIWGGSRKLWDVAKAFQIDLEGSFYVLRGAGYTSL